LRSFSPCEIKKEENTSPRKIDFRGEFFSTFVVDKFFRFVCQKDRSDRETFCGFAVET